MTASVKGVLHVQKYVENEKSQKPQREGKSVK